MTDKIDELKAALEGMERMLDERLKMMSAFVEFLKKQGAPPRGPGHPGGTGTK